jgi:opacity protein-like surface antigen
MRKALAGLALLWATSLAQADPRPSYLIQGESLSTASDWTGVWVGAFVGGGLFPVAQNSLTGTPASESAAMIGGAQFGYDHQIGQIVFGASVGAHSISNRRSGPTLEIGARLGYVILPNALIYMSGGLSTAQNRLYLELPGYFAPPSRLELAKRQTFGFLLGVGLEYRMAPNWSVSAEYVYADSGSIYFDGPFVFNGYADTFKGGQSLRLQSLRFGVRYRF